jgi:GH24 family phage-related lysozyme (muramidase)
MRRSASSVPAAQIPLGLEPTADPASESALRAAYRRLELSRRLAFEDALADPAYAIGIRNLAEATARRINRQARRRKTH